MTPQQFLRTVAQPQPAYLFVGPEQLYRDRCRAALVEAFLPDPEERENGYIRHDLEEVSLGEAIDDARSMSLFAGRRLIWISGIEAALPRARGGDAATESDSRDSSAAAALNAYLADPNPGVVLVLDSRRIDFGGEDKAKMERLRKFFSGVKAVVEFARPDEQQARQILQDCASSAGLQLGAREAAVLLEATGGDPSRIANEVTKLALYRPAGRRVSVEDITALVPNAAETTVFGLVNSLARGDRKESLRLLDVLVREGEYLPLVLTFLGSLFRLALAARESGLRSAAEVESHFRRAGMTMWRARAEQVWHIAGRLSPSRLQEAIQLAFVADKALKGSRPDDRTVMEEFVLRLTA